MIYLNEKILEKLRRKRVAIGLYKQSYSSEKRIREAVRLAEEFCEAEIVDEGENTEKKMIKMIEEREVEAVVRGTARASVFLKLLRKKYKPFRVAVLETPKKQLFLLAPVGVDEGKSVEEKLKMIELAKEIAGKLGMKDGVAILSGGRYGDVGRDARVDETLAYAELIAKLSGGKNYEIRLEDAIEEGIIIAPDGISGNLIFRSLCYLGFGREYGAVFGGVPYTIIDTSRSQSAEGFARALALATVV